MKQKLLILSITVFLCSTSIFQGQESLDYKIVEFYDSTTDDYTLTTKEEYTYDTNGRLSKVELYYWNSIAWDLSSKNEYTYNSNGYLTQDIYAQWNSFSQQWENRYRYDSNYTNNLLTEQISYAWNGTWNPTDKSEVTYSGNKMDSYSYFNWNNTEWVINERGTVTYNLNKVSEMVIEDLIGGVWTLGDRTIYVRDESSQRLEEVIWQSWDENSWKNEDLESFVIDTNGNRTSLTYSTSSDGSTWEPSFKTEYSYDNSALISNYYHPFNIDPYILEHGIMDLTYHNKVVLSTDSFYDDSIWKISSRTTYYYSDSTMSLTDLSNSDLITIYPNPVQNNLHIKLKNETNGNASLYDMNGRLVLEQKLHTLNTALNIETLHSGMYLLEILTANGFATKRITKN